MAVQNERGALIRSRAYVRGETASPVESVVAGVFAGVLILGAFVYVLATASPR